ncbi:MAG: hypothetical protein RJA70_4987, partial [Pseudomonadota bacterium]
RYHQGTIHSVLELMAACGFEAPEQLRPWNVQRRTAPNLVQHYGQIFEYLKPGDLLNGRVPGDWVDIWRHSTAKSFEPAQQLGGASLPPPITRRPASAMTHPIEEG